MFIDWPENGLLGSEDQGPGRIVGKPGSNNANWVELLFMTLSQSSPAHLLPSLLSDPANGGRHDDATIAICQKAAEEGLPTAQLALAQLYAARRAGPIIALSAVPDDNRFAWPATCCRCWSAPRISSPLPHASSPLVKSQFSATGC